MHIFQKKINESKGGEEVKTNSASESNPMDLMQIDSLNETVEEQKLTINQLEK